MQRSAQAIPRHGGPSQGMAGQRPYRPGRASPYIRPRPRPAGRLPGGAGEGGRGCGAGRPAGPIHDGSWGLGSTSGLRECRRPVSSAQVGGFWKAQLQPGGTLGSQRPSACLGPSCPHVVPHASQTNDNPSNVLPEPSVHQRPGECPWGSPLNPHSQRNVGMPMDKLLCSETLPRVWSGRSLRVRVSPQRRLWRAITKEWNGGNGRNETVQRGGSS